MVNQAPNKNSLKESKSLHALNNNPSILSWPIFVDSFIWIKIYMVLTRGSSSTQWGGGCSEEVFLKCPPSFLDQYKGKARLHLASSNSS